MVNEVDLVPPHRTDPAFEPVPSWRVIVPRAMAALGMDLVAFVFLQVPHEGFAQAEGMIRNWAKLSSSSSTL